MFLMQTVIHIAKKKREGLKIKLLLVWISGFGGNSDALKYIFY